MNNLARTGVAILLKIFGGNIILSGRKKFILTKITNLTEPDLETTLPKTHSFRSWENEWRKSAESDIVEAQKSSDPELAKTLYKKATAKFYLASVFLSPDPNSTSLFDKLRESYKYFGELEADRFEQVAIDYNGQKICGYFQHPCPPKKVPVVLIMPPLGSVKEQLDAASDYFLKHGLATLRIDVAGFGETTGKLNLDFENNCKAVVSYLSERKDIDGDKILSMGISLGAYWTMRLAAIDKRVKLAVGISTPALYHEQWQKLPGHYWDHFRQYFGTDSLQSTKLKAEQMTLAGMMDKIECPTLLIHGKKDKISHPDAMRIFSDFMTAPLTAKVYPNCGHGCFEEYDDILPYMVNWIQERL